MPIMPNGTNVVPLNGRLRMSEASKEILRTAYVQGYAAIGIHRSRKEATIAVGNIKKKASGAINVRHAACCLCCTPTPRFF